MFKSIAGWFHRHPIVKTVAVGAGSLALQAAGAGLFGPKGVVIAGAVSAVAGLWIKRPVDATPQDKDPDGTVALPKP